jgi:uroporphyrin-III C-methyltransferase / precorrin-2 dehydrogenase / sirohydrochlorin ferrochelatase
LDRPAFDIGVLSGRLKDKHAPIADGGDDMPDEIGAGDAPRRNPSELALDAIRPLANLPVFFRLTGRRVVLAGGSEAAAWKAELLAASGADVAVFAPAPSPKMLETAGRHPQIALFPRDWAAADLNGATLAVADAASAEEAEAFARAARAAGAPVNVIDQPEFCDFSFGTIVNRSPLVIGISTDGAAPVFGQALRARIEALIPANFAAWAQAAKEWRPQFSELAAAFRQRRNFWERFATLALSSAGRKPRSDDLAGLLAAADADKGAGAKGEVVLVGGGPGDAELLTLKAVRALQSADVILFDDLISPAVLELARREAQRINVGKRGHGPSVGQADISALLVELGLAGKKVVRLKGGDPAVFGRTNEEIAAARAAGIACTIVPGITAALAAAASLGLSLSERDRARRIQFITAHAADGSLPARLDWPALVDPGATTAVYMGVKTLPALARRLLEEGLDPMTPAVMIENASLPEERRFVAPLADMPALIAAAAPTGPCMLLYGQTLDRIQSAKGETLP